MKIHTVALVVCWIGLSALTGIGSASTVSLEEVGDRHWRERARGFDSGRLDAAPAVAAMEAWEEALAGRPESLELRFKLMQAIYFRGHFLGGSSIEPRVLYDRLVELADETVELTSEAAAEDRARAYFWAAVAWGLWGQSQGFVRAGARGVAGKIRRHAERVIELDPDFADAGGLRLLGRLHTVAPRVPLFSGWIDREEGLDLLAKAHAMSTRDGRNALFLAEALLEYRPAERQHALELLAESCDRQPDPAQLVEESETIEAACEALQRAGGGEPR